MHTEHIELVDVNACVVRPRGWVLPRKVPAAVPSGRLPPGLRNEYARLRSAVFPIIRSAPGGLSFNGYTPLPNFEFCCLVICDRLSSSVLPWSASRLGRNGRAVCNRRLQPYPVAFLVVYSLLRVLSTQLIDELFSVVMYPKLQRIVGIGCIPFLLPEWQNFLILDGEGRLV